MKILNTCCFFIQVTLFLPLFDEGQEDAAQVLHDLSDYNRRFSGQPRSVCMGLEQLKDMPNVLFIMTNAAFPYVSLTSPSYLPNSENEAGVARTKWRDNFKIFLNSSLC